MQYRILDDSGLCVAQVDGSPPRAEREIAHYAMQYSQDGSITIQFREKGQKWADVLLVEIDNEHS